MATVDGLVKDFLAQKRIAVVGVSGTREVPANNIYQLLREKGYEVFAVSPHITTFDGAPCYPDIATLPVVPDGVVIITKPATTIEVVRQCIDAGVKRIWMHDMRGTLPKFAKESGAQLTSVADEALEMCRAAGVAVIPGSCPRQFIGDFGHTCMRWILRVSGALENPVEPRKAA